MWGKKHLAALIFSFGLYIIDMASDFYVAFQYYKNGDLFLFLLTAAIIIISLFAVNIAATIALKSINSTIRTCCCCLHLSMILLFLHEISRCRKEEAHVCSQGKHFSECACETCDNILKKSVKASFMMSHARSIETFCEAVPQCILQVIIMTFKKSFPWYTIVSVVISFISLVYGVYSLEKSFWIYEIVHSDPPINYIRPVRFPTRSAVIFILWQILLLLGRLSAMAHFTGASYLIGVAFHWGILIFLSLCYLTCVKHEANFFDGICSLCFFILVELSIYIMSFHFFFPLLVHVSYSSAACMKLLLRVERVSKRFIKVLLIVVPISFFLISFADMLILLLIFHYGVFDPFIIPYFVIGIVYLLAFVFQAIYFSSNCHPVNVTRREWEALQVLQT